MKKFKNKLKGWNFRKLDSESYRVSNIDVYELDTRFIQFIMNGDMADPELIHDIYDELIDMIYNVYYTEIQMKQQED